MGGGFTRIFIGFQVGNVHAEQFLLAVPAHQTLGTVHLQQTPLGVHQPDAVHSHLEDGAVLLHAIHQFSRFSGYRPPQYPEPANQQQYQSRNDTRSVQQVTEIRCRKREDPIQRLFIAS